MDGNSEHTAFCPYYHRAIELIGRRWTGAILRALLGGATRFSDIANSVPRLSDRLLSERLKELEAEGIVVRMVTAERPPRTEYHLTEKGRALSAAVEAVSAWAEEWLTEDRCEEAQPPASHDQASHDEAAGPAGSTRRAGGRGRSVR